MRYALVVLLVACKGPDPLTTGFTSKIEPPGGLRYGMSHAEVAKALPSLKGDTAKISSSVVLSLQLDRDKLIHVWAHVASPDVTQATLESEYGRLWGPPGAIPNQLAGTRGWSSVDTGWRAVMSCGDPATCMGLQFVAYRPLVAAYFGKTVAPPRALAPLRIGMSVDEVRAVVPELPAPQSLTATQTIANFDGGADDVGAAVYFDHDKVVAMAVQLPLFADAEKLLTSAWGPGAADHTWRSADWRAELVPTRVNFDTPNEVTGAELRFTRP